MLGVSARLFKLFSVARFSSLQPAPNLEILDSQRFRFFVLGD